MWVWFLLEAQYLPFSSQLRRQKHKHMNITTKCTNNFIVNNPCLIRSGKRWQGNAGKSSILQLDRRSARPHPKETGHECARITGSPISEEKIASQRWQEERCERALANQVDDSGLVYPPKSQVQKAQRMGKQYALSADSNAMKHCNQFILLSLN